jgi:PTH1 family peptidyl-tRNA hydrolase
VSSSPWLVVGLGNPGPEYAATRHNIGFLVADRLADQVGVRMARHKRGHALAAEGKLGIPGAMTHLVLVEPLSFMNESGGPVKALMGFYGVGPERLVVVHDELDIPFAAIRVKFGGGDNGHNGLKSIRRALGTGDFYRVRVGIDRPPGRQDPADYVLKPFGTTERKELPETVQRAADAVESLVTEGLERTQNRFNT